jgi:hypothetical protein
VERDPARGSCGRIGQTPRRARSHKGLQLRASFSKIQVQAPRLTSVSIDSFGRCRWETKWHLAMPSAQLSTNLQTRPTLLPGTPTIALRKHLFPSLYLVNPRVCLQELAVRLERPATLDDYAPNQSQCNLPLPLDELRGHTVRARDLMSSAVYERDGAELVSRAYFWTCPRGLSRIETGAALEAQTCELSEPVARK